MNPFFDPTTVNVLTGLLLAAAAFLTALVAFSKEVRAWLMTFWRRPVSPPSRYKAEPRHIAPPSRPQRAFRKHRRPGSDLRP